QLHQRDAPARLLIDRGDPKIIAARRRIGGKEHHQQSRREAGNDVRSPHFQGHGALAVSPRTAPAMAWRKSIELAVERQESCRRRRDNFRPADVPIAHEIKFIETLDKVKREAYSQS